MAVKSVFLTLLAAAAFGPLAAQRVELPQEVAREGIVPERVVTLDAHTWLDTRNPSAIGVATLPNYGTTQVGANYLGGDLRRRQQSGSVAAFGLASDSYCALPKINLYGRFGFTQEWHRDRQWADNFDPYNGNPYLAGSDIAGAYSRQLFDFSVMASSLCLWQRVWFGVGVDYTVGDFSRGNDPRSRVQLADYNVRPGFVVQLSPRSRLGVNGLYRHRKEKMLRPVAKAENIDKYTYYSYKGMAEYSTSSILFFSRRYLGDYYGGEVQYEYAAGRFSLLAAGKAVFRSEDVVGERKEAPGDYASGEYGLTLTGVVRGAGSLQKFRAGASLLDGRANEYMQESVTETNDQGMVDMYWKTILQTVRYRNDRLEAELAWRYYRLDGRGGYRWTVGAEVRYADTGQKYILPASSMDITSAEAVVHGGGVLLARRKWMLNAAVEAGYLASLSGGLVCNDELPAEKKTVIQEQVLRPDFDMLSSDAVRVGASVDCVFTLARKTRCFVSAYTRQYHCVGGPGAGSRYVAGLSLGILTDFKYK